MSASAGTLLLAIQKGDHALMRRVHYWAPPDWMQAIMICASRCGDGGFWYSLGFAVLAFGDAERWAAVLAGLLASGVGMSLYSILKKTTRRTRPCLIEPHVWSHMPPPDQYSFPSGHTIAAFANAISVGLFYPTMLPALLLCAALVGTSRIMLGMHFLSDVVVGALIGTSLGYGAFVLLQSAATR